jgi:hypothetical protein
MTIRFDQLSTASGLLAWRAANADQLDNTCGAYWARAALEVLTDRRWPDECEAAVEAATALVANDPAPNRWLPWQGATGVVSRPSSRIDLPTTAEAGAGTSPRGVGRAISVLSNGDIEPMPVQSNHWTAEQVVDVIARLAAIEAPVFVIANIATVGLAGSRRSLPAVLAELHGGARDSDGPPDWDVGHFCGIVGAAHGANSSYVGMVDTYAAFGWDGLCAQRPEHLAAALHRNGTGTGGLIVAATPAVIAEARGQLAGADITETWWSNGSPEPARS